MLLIIQIALGSLLGSAIAVGITWAIMLNPKFIAWFTKWYIKQVEKITESLNDMEEEL